MRISSMLLQGNQLNTEQTGELTPSELTQSLKRGIQEVLQKLPGQTITGEIVETDGSEILLSLGKGQLLQAKLDSGMNPQIGQQMSFGIKSIGGSNVVLTPLFENMNPDSSVHKALLFAGIPENETTVRMVQTMMQEGLKIDPESLSKMLQNIKDYPMADMESLSQLTRLNLPITENNLEQLSAYKNLEHQITGSFQEMADALSETASSLVASGKGAEVVSLYQEVLPFFTEEEAVFSEAEVAEAKTAETEIKEPLEGALEKEGTIQEKGQLEHAQEAKVQQEGQILKELLPEKNRVVLAEKLERAGTDEKTVQDIKQGTLPEKELFQEVKRLLSDPKTETRDLKELVTVLQDRSLNRLMKHALSEKWLLKPEEVGGEKKVEEFYQRLERQISHLERQIEAQGLKDTPFGKAAQNLSGNLDFMNQMNQIFHYVQLPLKLTNQNANGDLYVYTNKKNLSGKDGAVSAFLHLDLTHLGSVDVHVSLKDTKVSTKFYLQDDAALDLVEAHIDMLNERLQKRGYSMDVSIQKQDTENEESVIGEMLKQDKNISVLSSSSFDARA